MYGHCLNNGILWVAVSDPWSVWTNSGASREICLRLKGRGVLTGAISPDQNSDGHLGGPRWWYHAEQLWAKLRSRFLGQSGAQYPRKRWRSEKEGVVGQVLRRVPPGTAVIYVFLTPEYDLSLPIRRFRYMGMSTLDAVRFGAFGHQDMSDAEVQQKWQRQKESLEQSDGVVVQASYTAEAIARDFDYPREKITATGLGPALPSPGRSAVSFDTSRYEAGRILFVGRDWKRKGGDLLVEAFRMVQAEIPRATLTIVGPSAPPTEGEGIRFIGPLNKAKLSQRRRLEQLFLNSSVFCMPSESEPWGLVYVEAAQAGMPIVGFHEWSLPDIVEHKVSGWLATERSAEALAEGLVSVLRDPQAMSQMGQAAYDRVREVLDWPHVLDRLLWRTMPDALQGRQPVWMEPRIATEGM